MKNKSRQPVGIFICLDAILCAMTGKTHFALGANAVWIAPFFGVAPWLLPVLAMLGGLAGLLPDIDTRKSELSHATGGLTRMFLIDILFRHRSVTHSLLGVALFAALSSPLFKLEFAAPCVAVLGYVSHPFIDGFNPQGCEYFYPLKNNYRIIPKFLCVDTGGWIDHLLFAVCCLSLVAFLGVRLGWIQISLT